MAEAWDDESIFKHGLEAGHGVDLQTSTTRFFSTTNGVPTTDRKLFDSYPRILRATLINPAL